MITNQHDLRRAGNFPLFSRKNIRGFCPIETSRKQNSPSVRDRRRKEKRLFVKNSFCPHFAKREIDSPSSRKIQNSPTYLQLHKKQTICYYVLHNLFLILFGIFANVDCQILFLQRSIYLSPQSKGRLLFRRLVYRAEEQKEFLRGTRKGGGEGVSRVMIPTGCCCCGVKKVQERSELAKKMER